MTNQLTKWDSRDGNEFYTVIMLQPFLTGLKVSKRKELPGLIEDSLVEDPHCGQEIALRTRALYLPFGVNRYGRMVVYRILYFFDIKANVFFLKSLAELNT